MDDQRLKIANILLKKGYFQISKDKPFQYSSGLTGPIYCDNRLALGCVEDRQQIILGFEQLMKNLSLGKEESILGMATGGIAYAALLADKLKRPCGYIRSSAKKHGKQRQIEGGIKENVPVILIEDLVNQGTSLFSALETCKREKIKVKACLCIVDYCMEKVRKNLLLENTRLYSLTDFHSLLQEALELRLIDKDTQDHIFDWHKSLSII